MTEARIMRKRQAQRIARVRWRISDLWERKWRIEKQIQKAVAKMSMLQEAARRDS